MIPVTFDCETTSLTPSRRLPMPSLKKHLDGLALLKRGGWTLLIGGVAWINLLFPITVLAAPASDWAYIDICNASKKTSVFVAQAYQFNWGNQYEVSGWYELKPSTGMGILGQKCMRLGKSMATPVYFAIAHRDEGGKMALYAHPLDEANWANLHDSKRWLCINPRESFRYTGRDFDDLWNCPSGGMRIPFPYLSKSAEGDENYFTVNPDTSSASNKLGTFEDIARGNYGAVAVDEISHRYGWAAERVNARIAGQAARGECGKPTCKVVAVEQAKCMAIAKADVGKFRIASAATQEEAMRLAATSCAEAFGACKPAAKAGCSGKNN